MFGISDHNSAPKTERGAWKKRATTIATAAGLIVAATFGIKYAAEHKATDDNNSRKHADELLIIQQQNESARVQLGQNDELKSAINVQVNPTTSEIAFTLPASDQNKYPDTCRATYKVNPADISKVVFTTDPLCSETRVNVLSVVRQ